MILRSSSTPVLGSLFPSFSESPCSSSHHGSELHGSTQRQTPNSIQGKLSSTNGGSQNLSKSLFHSPSVAEIKGTSSRNGFRRVQSEGSLEALVDASYRVDEFSLSKKLGRRTNCCCTLEAIPSFSLHHLGAPLDSDDEEEVEAGDEKSELEHTANGFRGENLVLEQERTAATDYGSLGFKDEGRMYLATGLGVSRISFVDEVGGGRGSYNRPVAFDRDGGSFVDEVGVDGVGGGGGSYRPVAFGRDGGDNGGGPSMAEHYKRMLEGDPVNPLVLRNYAQFMHQREGDLEGAEEYYSRAILADPGDGEILSQYAKLTWELHHDKNRAASYFERAIQASSEDSHIHAAYASFLWDTEDDEEENQENAAENSSVGQPHSHNGLTASATA